MNGIIPRLFGIALLIVVSIAAMVAQVDAQDKVNVDRDRIAIKGFDPVAYFAAGKPVKGSADFEARWQDARWQFSSAENRDRFRSDPERYAPRFGGFCALGLTKGNRVDVDPQAWTIVEGRLYLNFNLAGRDEWRRNPAANIQAAEQNWTGAR